VGRLRRIRTLAKIVWRKRRRPKEDTLLDVAIVVGLASFTAGWGWIFSPLAPIIGGCLLAGLAYVLSSGEPEKPRREEELD
jgi:hypothetical protein